MDKESLGIYIKKKRKEKGLTQTDVAEKLKVSVATVSKWERGLNFPDVMLFEPICNILCISITELFTQTDPVSDDISSNDKIESFMKEILSMIILKSKDDKKSKQRMLNIIIVLFLGIIILTIAIIRLNYLSKDPVFSIVHTEMLQEESSDLIKNVYILHVSVKGHLQEKDIKQYSEKIRAEWKEGAYVSQNPDNIRIYLYNKPDGYLDNSYISEINLLRP